MRFVVHGPRREITDSAPAATVNTAVERIKILPANFVTVHTSGGSSPDGASKPSDPVTAAAGLLIRRRILIPYVPGVLNGAKRQASPRHTAEDLGFPRDLNSLILALKLGSVLIPEIMVAALEVLVVL